MASRLLDECLKMPAIRRELRIHETDGARTRELRERDEIRSNSVRLSNESSRLNRQVRGDAARRDELERSIIELKKQLKQETVLNELRKVFVTRVKQASMTESALSRAAISERDRLAQEIIELYSELQSAEEDLDVVTESLSSIVKRTDVAVADEQTRKRLKVDDLNTAKMKSERVALRRLFFTLIMESGVDWLNDDVLREMVFSAR